MFRKLLKTLQAPIALTLVFSCGGGGGGSVGPTGDLGGDQGPDADVGFVSGCTTAEDCVGKVQDLGPCEEAYCDEVTRECAKRPKQDGTPCDDNDPCTQGDFCQNGKCVAETTCECRTNSDCKDKFGDLGQCETAFCNLQVGGGTCERRPVTDGTLCDDQNPCTYGDFCENGACTPGSTNVCDCFEDADCAAFDDGNPCNGVLICNKASFPYKCVVDPETVVKCDASADQFCLKNQCNPSTGQCEMLPANEGVLCDDNDVCSTKSECVAGVCTGKEFIVCDDNNLCTDDSCDAFLGCVYTPNNRPCDDGNACTVGDYCANAKCVSGAPLVCDDGIFCNGKETCDEILGCMPGTPIDCDDNNPCTQDRCDEAKDQCVHEQLETAKEGPMGSPTCTDGIDNDCDAKVDTQDPECNFGLFYVEPSDGPHTGGQAVRLIGSRLDITSEVVFGGQRVSFKVESDSQISLVTPPHEPGLVDVSVSNGWVTFVLPSAYRYTGMTEITDVVLTLSGPAVHEITEGETFTGIGAILEVTGVEQIDPTEFIVQVGYGLRGTLPWVDPSWSWQEMEVAEAGAGYVLYASALSFSEGGYLDVAARVSVDGGTTFAFADLDGSANGYDAANAVKLTVWGKPKPGAIVVNELMWMGSNENPRLPVPGYDEWFELRNMTRAPFKLQGYKLTNAAGQYGDLLFDDPLHTVYNIVIEPYGYFLVADYPKEISMIDVEPDIVTNTRMLLPNEPPVLYHLLAPDGTVLDVAKFTGNVGYNGDPKLGKPDRSMERNAVPGDGRLDENWHTAYWHEGWEGDPYQKANWGTPRGPNSDIRLCENDEACSAAFPGLVIGQCERRACFLDVGRCTVVPVEDGEPCEDGLFCTVEDKCAAGQCSGLQRDCSDDDMCSEDFCDEDADLCVHVPKECDDNNLCTTDYCSPATGECVFEPKSCDDNDLCTIDSCDPLTGECQNTQKDCNDNNLCTLEWCDSTSGECVYFEISCGDGDPCTADRCEPDVGCINEPIPGCIGCESSEDCADWSLCTLDFCVDGVCVYEPKDCSDNDLCTEDGCDDLTGNCTYTPVLCDDDNLCTEDLCEPQNGCQFIQKVCDDQDLCTVDWCDPSTGACIFDPVVCDDGNPCTLDYCDKNTGQCLSEQKPDAIEGPSGDSTCSDGIDNDCDGVTDGDDPQCQLAIQAVHPREYPNASGLTVTVKGQRFDIVTMVLVGVPEAMFPLDFEFVDSTTITLAGPEVSVPVGDYDIAVSDGVVTATLSSALRVIDKDTVIWGNTQWPDTPLTIQKGQATETIYGRIWAPGITDSGGDPALIKAELGFGPPGTDPFLSPQWVFTPAVHNPLCLECGNNYEYMASLVIDEPGEYIVGFRYSVDGGFHWAYGDLDGWQNGWDPNQALKITVTD